MVLTVLLLLMPLVVVALLLAAFYKWEMPRQRRWYSGTGLPEWRKQAAQLPWRDRYALSRANSRGRAVEPRLAPLAVERGTVTLRAIARMQEPGSGWRRLRTLLSVIYGVNLVVSVLLAWKSEGAFHWLMVGLWLVLIVLWATHPLFLRRGTRRIAESVRVNQAVLEERSH